VINTLKSEKLRVGVLMGGRSIEREVSFNSGRTICDHLDTSIYEIIPIFQTESGELYILPWHFLHRGKISDFFDRLEKEAKKIKWDDLKKIVDFVYLALHGRYGEDGTVQGFLEVLEIPYLGTKVFGSALGMDKIVQKKILRAQKIDIAKEVVLYPYQIKDLSLDSLLKELEKAKITLPCIVKPCHEGSSFGISLVKKQEDLIPAITNASTCDTRRTQAVLIEEKLDGMEFVCVCLKRNGVSADNWFELSVTQVVKEEGSEVFDYVQKYMPGRATKITPALCNKKDYEKIVKVCLQVTRTLSFQTISRIDGFLTKDGRVVIIDPNTLTGMSPATFLFHQAAEAGMNHTQLINYLIQTELEQYGLTNAILRKTSEKNSMANQNNSKIKVAVLLGGNTNEREISLESGRNICYKFSPQKYEVIPVFVNDNLELFKLSTKLLVQNSTKEISKLVTKEVQFSWSDLPQSCDFVFIGLHGGVGENGAIQGALEMLGLPYNGSGVFTSGLCMDKFKTCEFLRNEGFEVPYSILLDKKDWEKERNTKNFSEYIHKLLGNITFPLILKPHDDGCSIFVKKIKNEKELIQGVDEYFKVSGKNLAMLEEFISAIELTCGVIGNDKPQALPPSKVFAAKDVLSIEEKFLPGAGENLTPAPIPAKAIELVRQTMEKAYAAVGCKGYARIDCFYQEANLSPTKKDRVIILEFNTLPGMTPATCIFHQAAEIGLKPMEFIDKIVEFGFENHKHAKKSSSVVDVQKNLKQEGIEL
jgi:UDP-N-acetylmuramate--alanine ligase